MAALPLRRIHHELLYLVDDLLHRGHRNGTLLAGTQQAAKDFLPFKLLPAAIFLDHHVRDFIDALVRGKALFALQAFAPPADGSAIFVLARIDDFVVFKPTKWAFHRVAVLVTVSLI